MVQHGDDSHAIRAATHRDVAMLRGLIWATLGFAVLAATLVPDDAFAGGRWRRHAPTAASVYPGWGYYSYPWGYVIPTAPYAYPVVYNCLRRYPSPRPWGLAWREAWVC